MRSRRAARRGAMTVCVLVCLLVISSLGVALLRIGLSERKRVRQEAVRLQAEWLGESALERASARLRTDPKYSGETWAVSADDLGGGSGGRVVIAVQPVDGKADQRRVRVTADYPTNPAERARQSKELVVTVPSASPSGSPSGRSDAPGTEPERQ